MRVRVCIHVCICLCMYLRIFVLMSVCMDVWMCLCLEPTSFRTESRAGVFGQNHIQMPTKGAGMQFHAHIHSKTHTHNENWPKKAFIQFQSHGTLHITDSSPTCKRLLASLPKQLAASLSTMHLANASACGGGLLLLKLSWWFAVKEGDG